MPVANEAAMNALWSDLQLAVRRLLREPLFAAVAILTLAIGVGANSAIFTLADGLLLRPLPYPAPDRLVAVTVLDRDGERAAISGPIYLALRERNQAFTSVAVLQANSGTLAGSGEPERVAGVEVSGSWFATVGVSPLLGRTFTEAHDEPGADGVIVLAEGLWRERFGADPTIVGRAIELEGRSRTVLGVMPAAAAYPHSWRYWVPLEYRPSFRRPANVFALSYDAIARLRPGTTLEAASAEVASIEAQAEAAADMPSDAFSAGVMPLRDWLTGDVRTPLLVLMGAVACVLLIACANLANLLLAQTATRRADFAIRRSLGARPGRIARQLTLESLVLGLAGGGAGLLVGGWTTAGLVAMLPASIPHPASTALGLRSVVFTLGISLVAALLVGLVPILQARGDALGSTLRDGGRSGSPGRAGVRLRSLLVVAETALAFALVIGAGLLIRTLDRLRHVDPGFRTENTLTFDLSLPATRYDSDERLSAYWAQVLASVETVPGVRIAGIVSDLPLGGNDMDTIFELGGRPPADVAEEQVLHIRIASPGYLEAFGIPLARGRALDGGDRAGARRVAMLNRAAVDAYFHGIEPIGQHVTLGWSRNGTRIEADVVGIVGNVLHSRLRDAPAPEIYLPVAQVPRTSMSVVVKASGDPARMTRAVEAAVHRVDRGIAVANLRRMRDVLESSVARDRFLTKLLSALGIVAVALALAGIFGVVSHAVAQRRREIGVRLAVGATRSAVVRLVVGETLRVTAAGVVCGVLGALALTRLLQSLLFGVSPGDPATFAAGALVLLACAAAASALPALRAARLPPRAVLEPN